MQSRSAYVDTHDELTGLPNRRCVDELARALALDQKSDLVIVLVQFGAVDADSLKTIAQRLRECARGDDVVARLDDGRFVILLTPRVGRNDEAKLLTRLRCAIAAPTAADSIGAAATVGVAYCPEDGTSLDQLLAQASLRLRAQDATH